jgi:AcrR family transcriptional regulator
MLLKNTELKKSRIDIRREKDFEEIQVLAIGLLEKNGFKHLKLEQIIDECIVSRVTFYKFVPSKEALYSILAVRGLNIWLDYIARVNKFQGVTRVKMIGHFVAYYMLSKAHPVLFKCIFMHNHFPTASAVELDLAITYRQKTDLIIDALTSTIALAIKNNELELPEQLSPYALATSYWHGVCGVTSMELHNENEAHVEKALDYYRTYIRSISDLLNWRPLSTELNYDPFMEQIMKEIFPKELKKLKLIRR